MRDQDMSGLWLLWVFESLTRGFPIREMWCMRDRLAVRVVLRLSDVGAQSVEEFDVS